MRFEVLREKLEHWFLVCRNEWGSLVGLSLLNFLISCANIIAFSVFNALLVGRLGFEKLPETFIISALLMIPYFIIYGYLEQKFSRFRIFTGSFILYALMILGAWGLLYFYPELETAILIAYVTGICIIFLANMQFWAFAGFIYMPRQGKRLFPLLSSGGIIGAVITGFLLGLMEKWLGVLNLLFVIAGLFVIGFLVLVYMRRHVTIPEFQPARVLSPALENVMKGLQGVAHLPILKALSAIILLMSFVSFILFFQFNNGVEESLKWSVTGSSGLEDSFVGYVGMFNAFLFVAIFLFYQLFFTSHLVSGFGIIKILYLQPVLLFFPVVLSAIFPDTPTPLLAGHFLNIMCLATFFKAATEAIYGAVPEERRDLAVYFIKVIVTPLAIGLSGLVLVWFIGANPDIFVRLINYLLVVFLFIWCVLIWYLQNLYMETLFDNFALGLDKVQGGAPLELSQLTTSNTLEILRRSLNFGSVRMKKFAIELVGEMKLALLRQDVSDFLVSDEPELRDSAITALGNFKDMDIYPRMMKIYKEQDGLTRVKILKSLQRIDHRLFDINAPLLLAEEDNPVPAGFLINYLWRRRPLTMEEEEKLLTVCGSDDENARSYGARCLAWDRNQKYVRILLKLLEDPSSQVQISAIRSCSETLLADALNHLMNLIDSEDESVAGEALSAVSRLKEKKKVSIREFIKTGDSVSALERKLCALVSGNNREEYIYLIGNFREFYPESLVRPFRLIADNIVESNRFENEESALIESLIEECLENIKEIVRADRSLLTGRYELIQKLFPVLAEERINSYKKLILTGLHLLNPSSRFLTLMDNLFQTGERKRQIALEALENLLPARYKKMILPLFEKENFHEEVEYLSDLYYFREMSGDEILEVFNRNADTWLLLWQYLAMGEMNIQSRRDELLKDSLGNNRLLAEHAALGLRFMRRHETGQKGK